MGTHHVPNTLMYYEWKFGHGGVYEKDVEIKTEMLSPDLLRYAAPD